MTKLRDAWNDLVAAVEEYRMGQAASGPDQRENVFQNMRDAIGRISRWLDDWDSDDLGVSPYLSALNEFVSCVRNPDGEVNGAAVASNWELEREQIEDAVTKIEVANRKDLLRRRIR